MSDDYEAKYMQGEGTLLHREKTVWKLHWILLFTPILMFLAGGLGVAGLSIDHGHPMSLGGVATLFPLGFLMLLLWLNFISLRVHVTTREVHVQFGLFGPKIPVEAIDAVAVRDYPALALGTILWAQDPDKLAAIIQEARTGKKVRVEEFEAAAAEVAQTEEAEDEEASAARPSPTSRSSGP